MKIDINTLNKLYRKANNKDEKLYYEQKSNVLLDSGKHYSSVYKRFTTRIRESSISESIKIRLTKNHINKICKIYKNSLLSASPAVKIMPANPNELQDKKDAELSQSVWEYIRQESDFDENFKKFIDRFVVLGEGWILINFNPNKGKIKGYKQIEIEKEIETEEGIQRTTEIIIDETQPIYEGKFEFDVIDGYDVFIDPAAKSIDEARFIGIRKLTDKKELENYIKELYADDEEELNNRLSYIYFGEIDSEYYTSIDLATGDYLEDKDKVLVREFFFKPDFEHPRGKYVVATEKGILYEEDLPTDLQGNPIFPIVHAFFDEFVGSARGFSIIRQLRPYQAEINRAASKIAETQILLGDDKIITYHGQSLSEGNRLAGLREYKIKGGMEPIIIQGRGGEQFLNYMLETIREMYEVAGIPDFFQEKTPQDIMASLYQSLKQQNAFVIYAKKVEKALTQIVSITLKMAKVVLPDDKLIKIVGRSEYVSIPEFRETNDMSYSITIKPANDDVNSVMGKYLQSRDLLQYVGGQLTQEQIGLIAKYGLSYIKDDVFSQFIEPLEVIEQILLQLDRGIEPPITPFDDNEAIIRAIVNRMKKPDFMYVVQKNPQVYQAYMRQYEQRTQILNQKIQELKEANMGIIPTGGGKVKIDVYSRDEKGNPERMAVDYNAIKWFLDRLSQQGAVVSEVGNMPEQAQIDIFRQLRNTLNAPAQQEAMGGGSNQSLTNAPNGV